MLHEDIETDGQVIKALASILHEQWDAIVHEKNIFDIDAARRVLFQVTEKQALSQSVAEMIAGQKDRDDDADIIELLAKAMAEEFLQTEHPLQEWTWLLSYWDAYVLFRDEIKNVLVEKTDACAQMIWRISLPVFEHPECLLFGEKEEFISSVKHWENEINVQELWGWGARDFFPYEHDAFFIPMLLFPERIKDFFAIISRFKSPVFLYNLFASIYRHGEIKALLDLLREAPISVDDAESIHWNRSWIAPVLLDEMFHKIAEAYPANRSLSDDEKTSVREAFIGVGNVLCDRIDGFFLVCNYMKYLSAGRERNQFVVSVFLDVLGDMLHENVKARFPAPKSFSVFFSENVDAIRKSFVETGKLWKKQDRSAYTELVAVMQFFFKEDEFLKQGRFFLETALMLEDDKIHAYEARPSQCHYDIAAMYLTSFGEQVATGWQETWRLFAMARCRSNFIRYDSESVAIKNRLNFLLLIALALLNQAYTNRNWTLMDTLWESLWCIMEGRLQQKASKDDDFNMAYIKTLFLWKAVQFKTQKEELGLCQGSENEKLADVVMKLKSYHEMYLQVIDALACKGYLSKPKALSDTHKVAVVEACHKAMVMCKEMDHREHLEMMGARFLKNWSASKQQ